MRLCGEHAKWLLDVGNGINVILEISGRWNYSDIYNQSVPWNSDLSDRTRFATNNDNARILNNKILNLAGEGPTYMSIEMVLK